MRILRNIPLARYTTFGIGGPAEYFCRVRTLRDARQAFSFARRHALPMTVIGGGSNVLVSDGGVAGLVVYMAYDACTIRNTTIDVGAGMPLDALVERSVKKNLRGLENLSGIPGTVGGAIFGCARAFGSAMGDVVKRVHFFDGTRLRSFDKAACEFAYGTSVFKKKREELPGIIWKAELGMEVGSKNPWEKMNLRQAILAYRNVRYPARNKSAGCFLGNASIDEFSGAVLKKLPRFAKSQKEIGGGYLLEQAGVAGKGIGGAKIARHHANYFLNVRHATARDVIRLVTYAQRKVFLRFGVRLRPEVRCIGFSHDPFAE